MGLGERLAITLGAPHPAHPRDLVKRQAGLLWILEVTAIAGGLTTAFHFSVYFPLSRRKAFGSPCKCPVHQAANLAFIPSHVIFCTKYQTALPGSLLCSSELFELRM